MKSLALCVALVWICVGCGSSSNMDTLYHSEAFTITTDKVSQGNFEAVASAGNTMSSTYQSPANVTFPRHLEFKFSLNGKDNELPFGVNHHAVLRPVEGTITLPPVTFGRADGEVPEVPDDDFLEPNTSVVIQADLSPVMEAFDSQGYYEGADGSRLAKEDFKGVFVAGNLEPLSWDFENLPSRSYAELKDEDGDGIFTATLVFNVYNADDFTATTWTASKDVSKYPTYASGSPLLDALYTLSLEEMLSDIRSDGTFRAGAKWDGVWTRDISYSILLALAIIEPEITKNSLRAKTGNGRIIQDTGTGGAWPISSDRMTWALAAWEVYLTTGDQEWLAESYALLSASATQDLATIQDEQTGLMRGESSFLDWRKQSYPRWMGPIDIYNSLNLGTNAVHFQTYQVLAQMARVLGKDNQVWTRVAQQIKEGINTYLWSEEQGYYGQYLYGREFMLLSDKSESLGEALCVIFGIAEDDRAAKVVASTPVTTFGVPCIYPQIPDISPYHNNGIWPFVQAYYTWAAADVGNASAVEHGMAGIIRAAALFLTNKENMVAETGDFEGTEINSDAQLWSVAGQLSLVYRVLFGMRFSKQSLSVSPFVPASYGGIHSLKDVKYRDALLNLTIIGSGNSIVKVEGFEWSGEGPLIIPANTEGTFDVTIHLSGKLPASGDIRLVENAFALPTPNPVADNEHLIGGDTTGEEWKLLANGAEIDTWPSMMSNLYNETSLRVQDRAGYWSFMSEPEDNAAAIGKLVEVENFGGVRVDKKGVQGYTGSGFVNLTKEQHTHITIPLTIEEEGYYRLDFRYSNGNGPINTHNACALRTLSLEGEQLGVVVLPQLGFEEWSTWGYSNGIRRAFHAGQYTLSLTFEDQNQNMNFETNQAYVDHMRVVRLPQE